MRIEIACFSQRGHDLAEKLRRGLARDGDEVNLARCGAGGESLSGWIGPRFSGAGAIIFVGAAGIAVRAVAPHLVGKTSDPAVVAVDEAGLFAVALVSGHIGGANRLARRVAEIVGATPVITTATDVNQVFAVDQWAAENGHAIVNPGGIKSVSSKLLRCESVGLRCAFPVDGPLPRGVRLVEGEGDFSIGYGLPGGPHLHIVPRVLVLGVGCRKGTEASAVEGAFEELCRSRRLCPEAVAKVCSIDLKKEEAGIAAFAEKRGLAFTTFDAASLAAVAGVFSASEFVAATTGVDNVCERSAVLGSGNGALVAGKTVYPGLTLAVAAVNARIRFVD